MDDDNGRGFQATYRFITVESGLMEPEVDGKPLLSLNDLEARLVFTRCKVSAVDGYSTRNAQFTVVPS